MHRHLCSPPLPATLLAFALLSVAAISSGWAAELAPRPARARPQSRVPLLPEKEAWKRLPTATKGAGQPLPLWARALAPSLPRTTAVMLELDYLHRARSPLAPQLRGRMRWVAAHANRCAYTEAYAAADLRRAGLDDRAIRALAGEHTGLPAADRAALEFARKLTLAADTVTGEDVARLIKHYGERQVVAMVLLLAHANFQDRLIGALGLAVEEDGPLPPQEVRFRKNRVTLQVTPRRPPNGRAAPVAERITAADWRALDFARLQKGMEQQRARRPRIRVPSWEEVRKHLPPTYPANRPLRILWSRVCLGYQPELAAAWSLALRTFAEESRQDRVFEETLFWVITRTLRCFY